MKIFATALLVAQAVAYPQVMEMLGKEEAIPRDVMEVALNAAREELALKAPRHEFKVSKRADNATQLLSINESNCGPHVCKVFNAEEQAVSVTGKHAFLSPGKYDTRGPCPGLNAAANHGYLPRSGYASILDTITGLGKAYGMSAELGGVLAAYAVIMTGDPLTLKWSIGGPIDGINLLPRGQGISFSHNKYEGDSSITRPDIYLAGPDGATPLGGVDLNKARNVIASGGEEDRITLDSLRHVFAQNQHISITQNPRYFAPLFSTTLVVPAAYNFVVNFMSNHTAEQPEGYLNADIFKTFFGLSGEGDNLVYNRGQERIPENWYRRSSLNQYSVLNVFEDLIIGWLAYPNNFRFGGNINGVDTYRGVDIQTLTRGKFDIGDLFQGNNLACLIFQTQQQAVPDFLKPLEGLIGGLLGGVTGLLGIVNGILGEFISPIKEQFACPPLDIDHSAMNGFPSGA